MSGVTSSHFMHRPQKSAHRVEKSARGGKGEGRENEKE
jgi:hypothetical protein